EVFREFVKSVAVRKNKDHFQLFVQNIYEKKLLDRTPLVLVDDVPVHSCDELIKLDALKVKKIEVVTRQYQIGDMTFDGIISLTTYEGNLAGLPLPMHYRKIDWEGFQLKNKFYSPSYYQGEASHVPDYRYLLHWEPNIRIEKNISR